MVALGDPRDVSNLHPHNALRGMLARNRRGRAGAAAPASGPRRATEAEFWSGWVELPSGALVEEPSELFAWPRGCGPLRPVPAEVVAAWSEV